MSLLPSPQFLEAVRLFNEREFFDCHDVLEELWNDTLGPERQFYQGLIHAAVALFHFGEGNLGGARKMFFSSVRYLEPYRPGYGGIDLEQFLAEFCDCFAELISASGDYPVHLSLDESRIPRLRMSAAGDERA